MIIKIKFEGPNRDNTKIVTTDDDNETNKKTIINSTEFRDDDFTAAMKNLLPPAQTLLPLNYEILTDRIDVVGISISENEKQGLGCVLTLQISTETFNAPMIINTPHLHEDLSDTGIKALPWEMAKAVRDLTHQAELFLAGHRAQENLPFSEVDGPALSQAVDNFYAGIKKTGMQVTDVTDNTITISPIENDEVPA